MISGSWRIRRLSISATAISLFAVLIAALGLRLFAIDWDDGAGLHPDERFIVDYVLVGRIQLAWPLDLDALLDPRASGLNPRSVDPNTGEFREFAYGALPLFVTEVAAEAVSRLTGRDWHGPDKVHFIGRSLSAAFDTLTVLVIYLIGVRVFSRHVGLLAALVAAMAPMSIQLAHFFTTDSWLTFFVAVCLLACIRAAEHGSVRWFAVAGMTFGLAMATKGSVFTLAGLIGAATLFVIWRWHQQAVGPVTVVRRTIGRLIVAGFTAVIAFGLFEPYALARPDVYLQSLRTQADIVRGLFDVPFTRQYVGTTRVAYQIDQLIRWGFGPVAGALALVGVIVLILRFRRDRSAGQWLLLAWFFGYGLVISLPETKFLRYLAPLVPVLAIMAGLTFDTHWQIVRARFGRRSAAGLTMALLGGITLWTIAFGAIYADEHPRLAASRWIYANVANGSTLSDEYWDDALPKPLGIGLTGTDHQFDTVTMDLYRDQPPADAATDIYAALEQIDYVILASNRVSASLKQSPWRYAVQNRYYELLADGRLGFSPAAEFTSFPHLGPFQFDDRGADESFINYDHPRVLIYRKDRLVGRNVFDQYMAEAISRPWSATRDTPDPSLLLDEPVGERPAVDDARWSDRLTNNSWAALTVWMAMLVVLQVVGWPLASLLLGRFADAGWGFARLLTLLTGGYLIWIGASLRLFQFRTVWSWFAILGIGLVSWIAVKRWRSLSRRWNFSTHQRQIATRTEFVFWAVFGLFLLYRYLNPDSWHPIWGGEKPMEFAHLNATLRSPYFPPHDPWFADGYINYYYYGLYLVAFAFKLTGIPSEIGFNLAQPTVIALLASGGFSLGATLGRDITNRWRTAVLGGVSAVILLLGIGNFTTAGRLAAEMIAAVPPASPFREIAVQVLEPVARLAPPGLPPASGRPAFTSFDEWTWAGSRAVSNAITEFPYFTALYADLHAHVVALPMTMIAIALAYAIATGQKESPEFINPLRSRQSGILLIARWLALMLVIGSLSVTNVWDVPVYVSLAVVAIAMGTTSIPMWWHRVTIVVGFGASLAIGAYLLFLPFFDHYVALFGSLSRVREPTPPWEAASHLGGLLVTGALGLCMFIRSTHSTDASKGLPRTAALLAAIALLTLTRLTSIEKPWSLLVTGAAILCLLTVLFGPAFVSSMRRVGTKSSPAIRSSLRFALITGFLVAVIALGADRIVLAIFLTFASVALLVWLTEGRSAGGFAALLLAAAAFIGAGTELVVIADDLIGGPAYRMNTIFKFYNQIWVLLAIAGAAFVIRIAAAVDLFADSSKPPAPASFGIVHDAAIASNRSTAKAGPFIPDRLVSVRFARVALVIIILVVAASALYPLFATMPRLNQRFATGLGSGTLNALDWMEYGTIPSVGPEGTDDLTFTGDRASIDWLNQNVTGSPVIAEASIGPYRCNGSRISVATGLPTIIGWERHQQQQRYLEGLGDRVAAVHTLYSSPDPAEKLAVIRRYDVAYVIVGDLERRYPMADNPCTASMPAAGIAAFDQMVGSSLDVTFTSAGTTIYRVLLPV